MDEHIPIYEPVSLNIPGWIWGVLAVMAAAMIVVVLLQHKGEGRVRRRSRRHRHHGQGHADKL